MCRIDAKQKSSGGLMNSGVASEYLSTLKYVFDAQKEDARQLQ
jgi:hypothetical protein